MWCLEPTLWCFYNIWDLYQGRVLALINPLYPKFKISTWTFLLILTVLSSLNVLSKSGPQINFTSCYDEDITVIVQHWLVRATPPLSETAGYFQIVQSVVELLYWKFGWITSTLFRTYRVNILRMQLHTQYTMTWKDKFRIIVSKLIVVMTVLLIYIYI